MFVRELKKLVLCSPKANITLLCRVFSKKFDDSAFLNIPPEDIRNFSIVAHVDHGKSTLADRILEMTGAILPNSGAQVLDKLQVERERGITVKAQTATLEYISKKSPGKRLMLNLIDTPGHVDFSYEVSRSLSACQGVVLLVDANQEVQAQTVANYDLAVSQGLKIIPVLNKIDLKNADPEAISDQMNVIFNIPKTDILRISAKTGHGVSELMDAIVDRIPPPPAVINAEFRGLIFDSWYDRYKGVIVLVYVADGSIKPGQTITSVHTNISYEVRHLGILRPGEQPVSALKAGNVGFIMCNMKSIKDAHSGDTLKLKGSNVEPLKGFKPIKPMVYAGVYPMDQAQHQNLKGAIEKLTLTDPSVSVAICSSPALGQGWRLGFLGLLHLDVFSQRLEQEYGALAVLSAPSVTFKAKIKPIAKLIKQYGKEIEFNNPALFPHSTIVEEYYEPMVLGTIITPDAYLGQVISLCVDKRGRQLNSKNLDQSRVVLQFILPLSEIVIDFHDRLKSVTSGFASFDYEDHGYEAASLVKIDILLNGIVIDELSNVAHYKRAQQFGKDLCRKLLDIIPRQQFLVAIQASVGSKVLAREDLKPYRKDVTAKLYGGDVTRRNKLLARQAEGKKKLRLAGNLDVPRDTFIKALKF
ncbi:translation factor GUF1 homolog, mitochondrial [Neocloeon triangulifer]|uniref:translation factor GUF1 homolog, mitochondrial n=1 Tax=Neocloeon triangulifer TaxID=2078957 RepID=UPI00286F8236|nr:translation factor GUF1 homolog, mitochondrial [Neocloeon triangulifer]